MGMRKQLHLIRFMILSFAVVWCIPSWAQISEGGIPPSFGLPILRQSAQPYQTAIKFNVNELKAEDAKNEAEGAPIRTAIIIPSDLSIEKDGRWTDLADGRRIWQLEISAPDAIALLLYYDEFYIPKGGKLFIYNKEKNHILGAYTEKTNIKGGKFATEFVAGDKLVLEYVSPSETLTMTDESGKTLPVIAKGNPRIKISGIAYGYNHLDVYHIKNERPQLRVGESGSCMININCPEGDNWQLQKRGVAKSVTPIGSGAYLCSGTILNNTVQDFDPLFLTASHCFYTSDATAKCTDFSQVIYYFNYESFNCMTTYPDQTRTMVGAELLVELPTIGGIAGTGGTDGGLLRLLNPIPPDYNVFYNGWDNRNIAPTSGVGIHHPAGDIKKISTYTTTAGQTTWTGGPSNQWWNVTWASTVSGKSLTEGGSSGSPLFNQNKRVVGCLTGGPSQQGVPKCEQPVSTHVAYYGKLSYHWDGDNTGSGIVDQTKKMKDYLDPNNSGANFIDGKYNSSASTNAIFEVDKSDIIVFESVNFRDGSSGANTWEWTFEGGTPSTFNGKQPPVITYNAPSPTGGFTAKLVVNKGTANESSMEVKIQVKELGDNPQTPVARFSLEEILTLSEGFDTSIPPTGWNLDKPGASTNQFILANMTNAALNFNTIDPNSQYSALVQHDDTEVVDTWLKSPAYTFSDPNTWLEFYGFYATAYIDNDKFLSVSVSTDGGNNWTEIWTNADLSGDGDLSWHKHKVDLSTYVGQSIRLGFRYYGQGGYFGGFDGIKIVTPSDPAQAKTINVGDYITPVEWSSGPPILYEWTFEGGTPATSTEQNPGTIRYLQPGTFDITLKVKNYRGEDIHTFTDAVTVILHTPETDFISQGYNRTDFARAIPVNVPVKFTDLSKNYPDQWNWTFTGGTPTTSTTQNPIVTYSTEGISNVSLTAKNITGENTATKNSYIHAGYLTHDIWNISQGETTTNTWRATATNYITGSNAGTIVPYSEFAELFDAPLASGVLRKIQISFWTGAATNAGNLTLKLYNVGADGFPSTTFHSQTFPISGINTSGYTTITLSKEVSINDKFYVAIAGFAATTSQLVAVRASSLRAPEDNRVCFYSLYHDVILNRPWISTASQYNVGLSMNIVPEFTYTYYELSGDKEVYRKNIDNTIGTASVSTNASWTATTNASWITISNGSGTGNGTFTYTVSQNDGMLRDGVITISCMGNQETILVVQAGPNPINLTATLTTESAVGLSWDAPAIKDIYDNIEGHTSFTLDSPGSAGWSYIDADGGTPVAISYDGETFPNVNIPSSFMVYTPGETTPPITDALFAPHSGNKFLACPKNIANTGANNDWIISPELGFDRNFKFVFWAKSIHPSYAEHIRVAYSTAGKTVSDFTNVVTSGSYVSVPSAWTKYEFTIPANAKYVALNCVSNYAFMLMVDDIYIGIGDAPAGIYPEMAITSGLLKFMVDGKIEIVQPEFNALLNKMKEAVVRQEIPATLTNETTGEIIQLNTEKISGNAAPISQGGALMITQQNSFIGIQTNTGIKYNIYRDGSLIANGLSTTNYTDLYTPGGNVCYTVTAVYNDDSRLETTESNEVCLAAPSAMIVQALDASRQRFTDNPTFNFTITGNLMGLHTIDEVRTWVTASTTANYYSPVGAYPIIPSVNNPQPQYVFRFINGILTITAPPIPVILEQPKDAVLCEGSNYTLSVKTQGEELNYQWYKGNSKIMGVNSSSLELKNITRNDYDTYYVVVSNERGTTYSEKARIYVVEPLGSISYKEFPDVAVTGSTYSLKLNGYSNVTKYTWSFSKDNVVSFEPESGARNETKITFSATAIGVGTIKVDLEHTCGTYSHSRDVNVKYPTGIDDVNNSIVKIYPNPVSNILNISYNQQPIKSVIVNDISGRTIERYDNVGSYQLAIQASKWTKGTYIIIIETNTGRTVQKVIKK